MLRVKTSVKAPNGSVQRRIVTRTSPIRITVWSTILATANPLEANVWSGSDALVYTKGWANWEIIVIVERVNVSERSMGSSDNKPGLEPTFERCHAARNGPLTTSARPMATAI